MITLTIFIIFIISVLPSPVMAHPELELRLANITEDIESNPGNPRLLVTRAELHAEHEDWEKALADLDLAASVDPSYSAIDFHRGRLRYLSGEFAEAERAMRGFLHNARSTEDPTLPVVAAHLIMGELMEASEQWWQAATHYDQGIRREPKTNPGYYIARARCLVKADESNYGLALKGLDERLAQVPGVHTLADYAVQLELDRGNVDSAVRRLTHLIAADSNSVVWRLRLAEVQQAHGRRRDAQHAYQQARDLISSLPKHSIAKMHRNGIIVDIERRLAELN